MTYCVGLLMRDGLVLLSDMRTNAGVDHISTFSKMHLFEQSGERVFAVLASGNLAISQAVLNLISEGFEHDGETQTMLTVPTMFRAAQLIGAAIRRTYEIDGPSLDAQNVAFDASFLLGGQIKGRTMRLFEIYSAGNFVEATPDTPFLQIGEHKYGKPILDRVMTYETDIHDAVKLGLISMDSTLRSNLTVGLPVELLTYRNDSIKVDSYRRITEDDAYFRTLRESWSTALRDAYKAIPRPDWLPED